MVVIPQRSGGTCCPLQATHQKDLTISRREYNFHVYILASRSRTLYIGMTNNLYRRIAEHREARPGTFTAQYHIWRLVHKEHFSYVLNAIAREKELKDWNREKKLTLIEQSNPTWQDLAESWPANLQSKSENQ